jgi:hypothetical protein
MRNPPITAVGMKSARSGEHHWRTSVAAAKTSERNTNDSKTSSARAMPGFLHG